MSREKPIIFTGESVRAIMDGKKTQTRRVMKAQPTGDVVRVEIAENAYASIYTHAAKSSYDYADSDGNKVKIRVGDAECCIGQPSPFPVGCRLWVKETFTIEDYDGTKRAISYAADPDDAPVIWLECGEEWSRAYPELEIEAFGKWEATRKPISPMFMPRWASRLTLEVTAVKVERVNEISEADAIAEGCEADRLNENPDVWATAVDQFKNRWTEINGKKHPWAANPWVWCVSFCVVK